MANNDNPHDKIKEIASMLQGTYTVRIGVNDQFSIDKLGWLQDANRDFLNTTPRLKQAFSDAMMDVIGTQSTEDIEQTVKQAVKAGGEAILRHILGRFKGGSRDVKMRPLSPAWVKRKGHNRIGIFTGEMYRDILNARIDVKKIK